MEQLEPQPQQLWIDEENDSDVKLMDSKTYLRMNAKDGLPEVIRIEPVLALDGELIPHAVYLRIDESEPILMDRSMSDVFVMNFLPLKTKCGDSARRTRVFHLPATALDQSNTN